MTISSSVITAGPYTGNGATTVFNYGFKIFNKADLQIFETDLNGAVTTLVLDTDYSVAGVGDEAGGSITLLQGALTNGHILYMRSNISAVQLTDFVNQGAFYAQIHEDAIDYAVRLIQQSLDMSARSLRFPDHYSGTALTDLPTPQPLSHLRWNAGGTGLENGDSVLTFITQDAPVLDGIAAIRLLDSTTTTRAFATGFATALDGGGGPYVVDVNDTTSADNNGTILVANDGMRWKLIGEPSLAHFGAVGSGDKTTEINAALATGIPLLVPRGTIEFTALEMTQTGSQLYGYGHDAILHCTATGANKAITIKASNCALRGFALTSAVPVNTYVANNFGIYANETVYNPSVTINYLDSLTVEGMKISHFGSHGIRFDYVNNSHVRHNTISAGSHGVHFGAGCFRPNVYHNAVTVKPGDGSGTGPYHPAYGVTITRDNMYDEADAPISKGGMIAKNWVNVPSWIGIDLHGAQDTDIIENYTFQCSIGIHLEDGNGPTSIVPVKNVSIAGNRLVGNTGTSFAEGPGIHCTGAGDASNFQRTISITNNTLLHHGTNTAGVYSARKGAIHVYRGEGIICTGNVIDKARGTAAYFDEIHGGDFTGNVIIDVQTVGADTAGLFYADGDCDMLKGHNTFFGASPQINVSAASRPDAGYQMVLKEDTHFGTATPYGSPFEDVQTLDSAGAIFVSREMHAVETEALAATDDLVTILGGRKGQKVTLYPNDSARTVVAKDGTGNVLLAGDHSMDNTYDTLTLICDGTNWREVARADNAA